MSHRFTATLLAATLASPALAQTSTSDPTAPPNNTSLQDPGTWVRNAIVRHDLYKNARVNAARGGERAGVIVETTGGTTGVGSGLGALEDLLNLAGSSGLGSLLGGDLSGLLGGLTGATTTETTETSGATDVITTEELSAETDTSSGGTGSLADLIRQRALEGGATAQRKSGTMQTSTDDGASTRRSSGAIGRLPKADERFQTTDGETTEERSFGKRFADAMLSQLFTALAAGVRLPAFVNLIEDSLRPLFNPTAESSNSDTPNDTGDDSSNDNSNGSTDDNANDNSGGADDGGGVEDLPDANSNDNSSGGTV